MLDYTVMEYEVEYFRKGSCSGSSARFYSEEDAVSFIKDERHKWKWYKLVKKQVAVIDF